MLAIFCFSLFAFFIGTTLFCSSADCDSNSVVRDLIILTDMEPDDRIALVMAANRPELSKRLLFVGTTLLNTPLKAALARRLLEQSGLGHLPVYAGTGGPPSSYPNNVETAKAALSFWNEEGNGILPNEELKKFREIDPVGNDSTTPEDETITWMSHVENIWSIVIEGLPESKAAKQTDRYLDDQSAVIRLLDMLNMDIPPKYVYRMPKHRGILTTAPRLLKVFFPVGIVALIVVTEWKQNRARIRRESELEELEVHFGMRLYDFNETMKRFFNGSNNFQKAKSEDEGTVPFYDANDEFRDETEEHAKEDGGGKRKKNKKKKKKDRFYDSREHFEQQSSNIHQKEERIEEIGQDDEASSHTNTTDSDYEMIREILIDEEEKRSIVIKGLYEYKITAPPMPSNYAGKEDQMPSPPLPSECYKRDFETAMDILYAIGVEVSPLAVHRLSGELDERRRRYLQVIFRSKKIVQIVLRSWHRLMYYTRGRKLEWKWLSITEFKIDLVSRTENKIGNKEQWSEFIGYLKHTPLQEGSQSDKQGKGKGIASSKMTKASHNELQRALIEAFSKAKENSIEIVLMTAPIDLVQVLDAKPELAKAIRRVHLMGGWVELKPLREPSPEQQWSRYGEAKQKSLPPPPPTIWGNYNLNMAPESSRRLFEMASEGKLPLRLYTYRHVWEMFRGSVNRNEINGLIEYIMQSKLHVMEDFLKAAKSWDEHAMKVMPYLSRFIGPYAGEQFSPADPILVVGLLNPESFIKERRLVKVNVKHEQLEVLNDVLEVQIEYDLPNSSIELITGLSKEVFRRELERSLFHCFKCGQIGHFTRDCLQTKCYRCGKRGHIAKNCEGN